jgi:hypothetical protein
VTQQLFDEVIGTPPPSTVDVHALVRGEKRIRTARRTTLGATAIVSLALATGLMVGTATKPGAPTATPATAQTQQSQDTRFQLLANDKESAEASAKRVSTAFDHAMRQAAPGAAWETIKDGGSNPTADGLPYIVPIFEDGPNAPVKDFSGSVNIKNDTRHGVLTLMIIPQVDPKVKTPKPPLVLACAGAAGCTEGTGPNGERVSTRVTAQGKDNSIEIRIGVAGDRLLILSAHSTGANPASPMTAEQLISTAASISSQIKA